jgi:hypothetical protein
MFSVLLRAVGIIQIALGLAYLFAPVAFLKLIGFSAPEADLLYPLGMLSARFIAYGVGFWVISAAPAKHLLWIRLMVLIQAIDLGVGVYYTSVGVVPLTVSGFPMFNAIWIALGLSLMRPQAPSASEPSR